MAPSVHVLPLPEYSIEQKPDYADIGPKIDRFIQRHLAGKKLALRCVFLDDHPELSRKALNDIILKEGTDRYDSNRRGMHHDWYAAAGVELHVVTCQVTEGGIIALEDEDYMAAPSFMGEFAMDFFESALGEPGRGYSLRMDLLLAFDLEQLEAVPPEEPRGYRFKNPVARPDALLGIVHILRAGETFSD